MTRTNTRITDSNESPRCNRFFCQLVGCWEKVKREFNIPRNLRVKGNINVSKSRTPPNGLCMEGAFSQYRLDGSESRIVTAERLRLVYLCQGAERGNRDRRGERLVIRTMT
jgi:hypothetical protein